MNVHWARGVKHYICSRRILSGTDGCNISGGTLMAAKVDQAVVADLLALYGAHQRRGEAVKDFQSRNSVDVTGLDRELTQCAAELHRLDGRLQDLRLAAGVGDLSLKDWRDLRSVIEGKQDDLMGHRADLEARRSKAVAGINGERLLLERMASLDRWQDLPVPEQKELLRDLAESIELFKPRGRYQPYEIKVVWRFGAEASGEV